MQGELQIYQKNPGVAAGGNYFYKDKRRVVQNGRAVPKSQQIFQIEDLQLDDVRRMVTVGQGEVRLTPIEYKILRLLMQEQGKVFSSDEIYRKVWNMRPVGVENTIAVHVRHIREKIEEDPAKPHYLKAVWGRGYMVE